VLVKNEKRKWEEESPRSQFDEKNRVGKNLQVIIVRLISNFTSETAVRRFHN
jgi:hypothetical protein